MNYFDCHADTLTEIGGSGGTLEENTGNLDLKRVGEFVEHYTQIFAIWKDAALVKTETREKDFFRHIVKIFTCQCGPFHNSNEGKRNTGK